MFNNTLKERKSITDGYEKTKYLNNNYTSKSIRNIKTRDGNKNKNNNKNKNYVSKKENTYKENNGSLNYSIELDDKSVKDLSASVENKYCSIPENNIDAIVDKAIDIKMEDEWIVVDDM